MPAKANLKEEKKNRNSRKDEILRLIKTEEIGTQQLLSQRLNEEGYEVTQATVSRDIKELGLIKVAKKGGGFVYKTGRAQLSEQIKARFHSLFHATVISVDYALNQLVIKCEQGMANAVCAAMDQGEWDGVIGSIAGDDTILIICRTEDAAAELCEKLDAIRS